MILKDRHIKAVRKEHKCYCCSKKIEIGEEAHYSVSEAEGDFFYSYYCIICDDFMKYNPFECGDEFIGEGEFAGQERYQDYKEGWLRGYNKAKNDVLKPKSTLSA
jgi:hypothetical protein